MSRTYLYFRAISCPESAPEIGPTLHHSVVSRAVFCSFLKLCATEIPTDWHRLVVAVKRTTSGHGVYPPWTDPDKISTLSKHRTTASVISIKIPLNWIDTFPSEDGKLSRVCLFRSPITFRIRAYFCDWPCQLEYNYCIYNRRSLPGCPWALTDINWPCGRPLGSEQRFSAIYLSY